MFQRNYDLIVLIEMYLDYFIFDFEIFFLYYIVFRKDCMINGCYGGGVLIVV